MKKQMLITLAAGLLTCAGHADTAAQWADKNTAALEAAVDKAALSEIVKKGVPAYETLFAQIKTGGESDPIASVTIAALTQHVMTKDVPKISRTTYAHALLAAAQKAKDADVTCFFLDQLRWCGVPEQARLISEFFAKSTELGVAELARITAYAVVDDRASKLKPGDPSVCRRFNQEIAKLSAGARSKRLMEAFDGEDNGVAGAALVWLNAKGNTEKTAVWATKLATVENPVRRVMLIDALATRGDKSATDAIVLCVTDADGIVVKAALSALIQLDTAFFVARFTETLKTISPEQSGTWRDAARQVTTARLIEPLLAGYATFNGAGRKLALDLFRERRVANAIPIALAAAESEDADTAIASYRVLRETGTPQQAETLLARLPKTPGRVIGEAQSAFAAIAKRDTNGTCAELLRKTTLDLPEQDRPVFYETAARIGGDLLLGDAEKTASSDHVDLSAAAIRALSAWADTSAVPALMRLALTAPDARNQTLALRGVTQKLSAKETDKNALREHWTKIRETPGNDENKNAINQLFK
ncbi:MAG: hypothetical protein FWH21_03715 [Kiritimatiellaeota bacterium]|nr:hypothetical protein [Kiritimatiellota bacterium]